MKTLNFALTLLLTGTAAFAASPSDTSQNKAVASIEQNQENMTLDQGRAYDQYLTRVMTAIHSLDPTMRAELPQWMVNDRELKRRIISILRKKPQYRSQISDLSDVTVTENPRTQELLRLAVADVVLNSKAEIEAELGVDMYDRLRDGNYDKLIIANPVLERRSYGIYFSFFKANVTLEKSGFAFEWYNGKEQIGYPFWLNGTMTIGGAFIRDNVTMRLGIDFVPANYGTSDAKIIGPLSFPHRLLEGSNGATGSLEIKNFGLDPSDGLLGGTGYFDYSFGLDGGKTGFSFNSNYAYNTSLIGLIYLTYSFPADGDLAGFSISAGGGAHRIDYNEYLPATLETKILSRTTLGDVYGRLAFDHQGEDHWGMSVQYSNLLLASAYYEFFGGFGLEAKYALRLNNRNAPWEYNSFFVISPRISISL